MLNGEKDRREGGKRAGIEGAERDGKCKWKGIQMGRKREGREGEGRETGQGNGAGYEVGRGSKQGYIPDLVINFCGPGERGVHGCPNDGPHPIEADRPGHQSEFRWRREGGGS